MTVATVFGGTAGVGREVVRRLSAQGVRVVFQGRSRQSGARLLAELDRGSNAAFMQANLYDYSEVNSVIAKAKELYGKVDVVVASGGTFEPRPKPFAAVHPDELVSYFESRLYHRLYVIHSAFQWMRDAGHGRIVTLTSDAGRVVTPAEALVGSAAAAQIFLVRALASELAPYGIRINCVSLSLTHGTPSWERHRELVAAGSSEPIVEAFERVRRRARFGICTAREVADLVVYLCSSQADKISGVTVSINGGVSFPG